ncbi:MAG: MFS transporter [Gammaproteobacteria bacterium]|nr:MFS transporter [Gammaproteobacteria bacterium]MDE2349986.1 MFS transporter [Gammaproteobacteria bacterium]
MTTPAADRSTPLDTIVGTWPLLLGMGVLMLGAGLQSTLLGVRATLEGFPTTVTGVIMSCYYVGYLFGTMTAPRIVRTVGHIRAFAALAAVSSAAILTQGVFVNPVTWGVMRLLSGLCFAGIYVVAESWLNDRASRATRGRLFAIYMVVLYIGLGTGQFLLIPWDTHTSSPFMVVAVLISLAMVPIVLSAQQAPEVALPRKVRLRDLYRDSPLGVAGVTIAGLISSIIFSMGPVYARLSGLGMTKVAAFMSLSILAGVVMQYPVGRLSDKMDRRAMIAMVSLIATGVAGGIAIFSHLPHPVFLVLTATFSGFALTLYSLSVSHVNDKLESAEMVAASSALLRINGTAAAFGPALIGALMALFGPRAYFASLASLTGALTLFDVWRSMRRRAVPGQKNPFVNTRPRA